MQAGITPIENEEKTSPFLDLALIFMFVAITFSIDIVLSSCNAITSYQK